MSGIKNFYIVTGKGGVGKTTQALALCKYLQENTSKKVIYAYFKTSSIKETEKDLDQGHKLAQELGLEYLGLELKESARTYITKKLKSSIVASWIVKTPFFKALINMLPGFSYLIYLGKLLEIIHDSKLETIVVLDSPSSGHALTMLEATQNFQEIFGSGIVFEDTKKMLKLLTTPGFAQVDIICLPTAMAIHEGIELKEEITKALSIEKHIFCNNVLNLPNSAPDELPEFLNKKISGEKEVLEKYQAEIKAQSYHCPSLDPKEIVLSIVPNMENLV